MEEAVLAPLALTALFRPSLVSSEMSHSTRERIPGDTLRQLVEEHDRIQEFKRFVGERCGFVRTLRIITDAVDHRVELERDQ
jgi:hypothetical protein